MRIFQVACAILKDPRSDSDFMKPDLEYLLLISKHGHKPTRKLLIRSVRVDPDDD